MDGGWVVTREEIELNIIGSFDHLAPAVQMRAIGLAMEHYFGSEDWLAVRAGVSSVESQNQPTDGNNAGEPS